MDLSRARILVCNDDGIHAPGLKVLEKIARTLSNDVWVVAPETEQSASGHSLTLTLPLRVRKISARRFAINGTPTDCVLLAVNHILCDQKPDLVLSGVNAGGNLGEDITYSGTVAAAMEGTLLGIPAVALSQFFRKRQTPSWRTAEVWTVQVLKKLAKIDWSRGVLMNVNFPDIPPEEVIGIEIVRQGRRKLSGELQSGNDPRGDPYFWIGVQRNEEKFCKGTDLEAIERGAVTVTPLTMDLTHTMTLRKLRGLVE